MNAADLCSYNMQTEGMLDDGREAHLMSHTWSIVTLLCLGNSQGSLMHAVWQGSVRNAVHTDALRVCIFDQSQNLWSCGLERLLVTHMLRRLSVHVYRLRAAIAVPQASRYWAMATQVLRYVYCNICQCDGLFTRPLRVSETL